MGNSILWSILQILGVFCPYISKNGQKTAVLKYFFSAFLSISSHILCLLARFLVFFCTKSKRNLLYDLLPLFLWSWNAKFFVFLGLKTLKKVKNTQKTQKNPLYGLLYGLGMVKFDFSWQFSKICFICLKKCEQMSKWSILSFQWRWG